MFSDHNCSNYHINFIFFFFCPHQARFWVQVMRDLRDGVKLKKVQERQYNPLPIEYQLTPYEMLMDDIRSKRYKLRKVMVRIFTNLHRPTMSIYLCLAIFSVFGISQGQTITVILIEL